MPCLRRCSTAATHSMPCINHQVFYPQAMGNSLSPPPGHGQLAVTSRRKRAKRLVKELPNPVARIGADAPSWVHRRRCALVFSDARWPRCSPRTESPVLAHLRTPSLLLPQIGCAQVQHTLLTRRTGAPANARLPRFRRHTHTTPLC